MLCPICERKRGKYDWSKAQWRDMNPRADRLERDCCTVCSPYNGTQWPPQGKRPHRRTEEMEQELEEGRRRIKWVLTVICARERIWADKTVKQILTDHMENILHAERKTLSYSGAIRCRDTAQDPVDWCGASTGDVFDPGNTVYARALEMLCPGLRRERGWNNETAGDIFEACLGRVYEDDVRDNPQYGEECPMRIIASLLEELAYWVWKVSTLQQDSLQTYVEAWLADPHQEWARRMLQEVAEDRASAQQ